MDSTYLRTGSARTARATHARRGLETYALAHAINDDVIVGELRPLIADATAAGLSIGEIGRLAEGRQEPPTPVVTTRLIALPEIHRRPRFLRRGR